jgi:hypothetical protein
MYESRMNAGPLIAPVLRCHFGDGLNTVAAEIGKIESGSSCPRNGGR